MIGIAATAVARGAGLDQLDRDGRHLVVNSWGQVLSSLVGQVREFWQVFTQVLKAQVKAQIPAAVRAIVTLCSMPCSPQVELVVLKKLRKITKNIWGHG